MGSLKLLCVLAMMMTFGACASREQVILFQPADPLPGFETSAHWGEQVLATTLQDDVRVHINAPAVEAINGALPTRLIIYALPNGNTIEWTAGKRMEEGDNWRYDIQHIAAQTRHLRQIVKDETIVVAYLEAAGLSWPAWRRNNPDSGARIVALFDELRELVNPHGGELRVFLTGHSGGGSFSFGYMNAVDAIEPDIDRIAFLDSNYAYAAEEGHGAKLLAWLRGDERRTLVVVAYDDREIELDGRKVVSPTGGTWRASYRLFDDLQQRGETFRQRQEGEFFLHHALDGQILAYLHPNSKNVILHTVMVGDMNGFIHAATVRTPWENIWGKFGTPRVYEEWVQSGE